MKIISKMLSFIMIVALTATLIITTNGSKHSNAYFGFSSLRTTVSCQTNK